MGDIDSQWDEAETWAELLSLNAQYIRQSTKGGGAVTAPFYDGRREDCIGSEDCDCYIRSLLDLHKYGILSIQGSPGLQEYGENEDATEYWQWREVPYMDFIIRDKEGKTALFITKLLEDERFTIYVVDGCTGEPCFGTESRGNTLKISRSADRKSALQDAKWEGKMWLPTNPVTLDDLHLENVKALYNERIYICSIAVRINGSVLYSAKDEAFQQEVNKINLPHKIIEYAKSPKMKSLRRGLLGPLWVGRGLLSIGRGAAIEAVLKPNYWWFVRRLNKRAAW